MIGKFRHGRRTLDICEGAGRLRYLLSNEKGTSKSEAATGYVDLPHGEASASEEETAGLAEAIVFRGVVYYRWDEGAEIEAGIRSRVRTLTDDLRRAALTAAPPAQKSEVIPSDLVNVAGRVANVKLDVRYATCSNFTGITLYAQSAAFLQRPAAMALDRVAARLTSEGLGLTIFDAYRPWHVTKMLWDAVPSECRAFVADPARGSIHNRGCAVDVSLHDLQSGALIEMTGFYDEMSERSHIDYEGGTSRQRWFRDLLRTAMMTEGFSGIPHEWWHFNYSDWRQYGIGNWTFEELSQR
jgi:D-alanyl-D-alanine dipeptidase